jgi:hypothetical protein
MILGHLTDWLLDDSVDRCILVETTAFNGVIETPVYISTRSYTTLAGESPSSTNYLPCITSVAPLTEKINLDGTASLSLGELSLSNHEGDLDSWLDWVFDNRDIKVLIGDTSWPRSQFEVIYEGICETLKVKSNEEFTIPVTDKLQKLNGALNALLNEKDETLPVTFGEVSNVKPKLIDPVNLIYKVHTRAIGGIIEVRDRGIPVTFAVNTEQGTFQLSAKPFGEITCSVWGDSQPTYTDTVSGIIQRIVTGFGPNPLQSNELDPSVFTGLWPIPLQSNEIDLATFTGVGEQCAGVYLDERSNVLSVISQLAAGIGASIVTSANGKIRLLQISDPSEKPPVMSITESNIVENSFKIRTKLDVLTSYKLGYNRNYNPNSELSAGLPSDHKLQYEEEWKFVKVEDAALRNRYRHTSDPQANYSDLQIRSEALTECSRWFNLFKTQRYLFSFDGYAELLQLELGDVVSVTHKKFGFSTSRNAMVVGLTKDWATEKVGVELFA